MFDYIVAKERLTVRRPNTQYLLTLCLLIYKLQEIEARAFFRQILASIHYAHQMGFIHRDLKPVSYVFTAS